MDFDFEQSRDAVARLSTYLQDSNSAHDVAMKMQADLGSPFHSFDLLGHGCALLRAIDGLLDEAMSATDSTDGDGNDDA